ncbi:MFS transporter [Streptosporangium sp. NPDC020072]|uniref:MFS transporter n=1 Tax=Streptosporangium jomthongense TaxID=1193683 RepID=A0ABV8F2F7_9ACTN
MKSNDVRTDASGRARRPALMLAVATTGFTVNFWAWALLSPLGPQFKRTLSLSASQQALLVAVPVVIGSLGRIPVGALTDRLGGRVTFPLVSAAAVPPVLFVGLAGQRSLAALLAGGLCLGVAGTIFAVGVPFVASWFPPERRGLAVGVFGIGMGGTAISALTTVGLTQAGGPAAPFLLTAGVLTCYAVVACLVLRHPPGHTARTPMRARPSSAPLRSSGMAAALRLPITWQASVLYAVAFGGYVAFSVYLPVYLQTAYGLEQADAARRMAGFVLVAVLARPLGGWLSDRSGPLPVLVTVFAVLAVCATTQAFTPSLALTGTVAFLTMAAAFGTGSGATFALVTLVAPADLVGSITGLVGAAGGLGGFVPPLVMGLDYGRLGSYGLSLALLAVASLVTLLLTVTTVRSTVRRHSSPAGCQAR